MQAIKAAEIVIKLERLLAGESEEAESMNVEEIIKREFAMLMTNEAEDAGGSADPRRVAFSTGSPAGLTNVATSLAFFEWDEETRSGAGQSTGPCCGHRGQ